MGPPMTIVKAPLGARGLGYPLQGRGYCIEGCTHGCHFRTRKWHCEAGKDPADDPVRWACKDPRPLELHRPAVRPVCACDY